MLKESGEAVQEEDVEVSEKVRDLEEIADNGEDNTGAESFHDNFKSYGLPPGELVDYDIHDNLEAHINFYRYSPLKYDIQQVQNTSELLRLPSPDTVNWIDVSGYDMEILRSIGALFKIHPLIVEDINERLERPKIIENENFLFITLNVFHFNKKKGKITARRFSLLLFKDLLLTFHECDENFFEPLKDRLVRNYGRLRNCGVDYLAYAILDLIVDSTFRVLDGASEAIEDFETELSAQPSQALLPRIHRIKHCLIILRRSVWPLREIFSTIIRLENKFFHQTTLPFLRDLHDHSVHAAEITESMREEAASMLDLYMSSIGNQLNKIMKVLGIISTIFLPLTFISSVYGMNFKYMPELEIKDAYPVVLIAMTLIAGLMLYFFHRKKWL